MLQEFYVDNFKSLINVAFRPSDVNLLLGLNNSGKTNLCQAMQFTAASALQPLDKAADAVVGGRFGLTNFYYDKQTVDFRVRASVLFEEGNELLFDYALTVRMPLDASPNATLEVEEEELAVTGEGFDGVPLLRNTRDGVRLLHETDHLGGHTHYVETSAPRDTTMLSRLYDLETNARANAFKRYLSWWQYYDLSPQALRLPTHTPNQFVLHTDGSNLSSVIQHLKTSDERRYRQLLLRLREFDPSIDLVNFRVPSENAVFMIFEDSDGHAMFAQNASAGTLRFLALTYALMIQPGAGTGPVVLVEEPENGIHVGALKQLVEMADEGVGQPQVIFTSHSPYFIDLFEDRLESVFVMKRDEGHSILGQPDPEKARKRLESFPLGEQHYREMLG